VSAYARPGRAPELTDRQTERRVLDRFLDGVRGGEGRALVVRGDPGVGKTVLLEYLAGGATSSGCRVVRATGVQSEMELAFAGLHQLCAPLLDRAGHLPEPQHQALRPRSVSAPARRRTGSWSAWPCWGCYRRRPGTAR
jgi:AAA ATPase domain